MITYTVYKIDDISEFFKSVFSLDTYLYYLVRIVRVILNLPLLQYNFSAFCYVKQYFILNLIFNKMNVLKKNLQKEIII